MTTDEPKPIPDPTEPQLSQALLLICQKIKEAPTRGEKAALMLSLASQFDQEHNLMATEFNENYHSFFEEYEASRMQFQHAAFRLARLALHIVDDEESSFDIDITTKPDPSVN